MTNSTMKKMFAVVFSIVLIFGNLTFIQPQGIHAASLDKAVTIMAMDENGENVLPLTAVPITEGDTAIDVLQEAGKKQGTEIILNDKEVTSINGVEQTSTRSWTFIASGKQPDTEAGKYKVSDNQHIFFALHESGKNVPNVTGKVSAKDSNGNVVIPETEVTLLQGSTAYDALGQAAQSNGKRVDASIDEKYLTFVNNVGDVNLGANDYWSTAVNGQTLQNSVVAHPIKKGDHVQLQVESDTPPEKDENENEGSSEQSDEDEEAEQPEESEGQKEQQDKQTLESISIDDKSIKTHINGIKNYISTNQVEFIKGQEWWVWGAAHTDLAVHSYIDSLKGNLPDKFSNLYDLERMIIAISAADGDATNVQGRNLVSEMQAHTWFEGENPLINALIYGLLAIDSGDYEVTGDFRQNLVDGILRNELEGGGWSFFGDTPSPDMTGMVLSALAPYKAQPDVKKAIDRGVDSLASTQGDSGGYDIKFNGGDSSESVSQAIIGLAAVGVDPTSKPFTKKGGNLVQHLLKFKKQDDGFAHLLDGDASNSMSTQQALLALVAYQKLKNGTGSVYQFTPKEEEKPIPEPDPDEPEEGGNDSVNPPEEKPTPNDQPKEIILQPHGQITDKQLYVEVTEELLNKVQEGQMVIIQPENAKEQHRFQLQITHSALMQLVEKKNSLKMNKGDTALLIPNSILKQLLKASKGESVRIQMEQQKVEQAIGAVYDYSIFAGTDVISEFKNGEITVELEADLEAVKHVEQDQIKAYYYDKKTEEWELLVNSKFDEGTGLVSVQVNHFSTYGVFEKGEASQLGDPVISKEQEITKNGSRLPDTATSMFNFMVVGIALLMGGIVLFILKRRKKA